MNYWEGERFAEKTERFFTKYKTIIVYTVVLLLGIFVGKCAFAQPLNRADANMETLDKCIHEDSIDIEWDKVAVFPLISACEMEFVRSVKAQRQPRKMVITSNCRPNDKDSFHRFCVAIDFYFEYAGDACDVWRDYFHDASDLSDWFEMTGWDDEIGLGVYFNLTHHIHASGKQARWGFDSKGNQMGYLHVLDLLEEKVNDVCN